MDENIQCIFDIENTLFNENRKSKIGREFSSKIRKIENRKSKFRPTLIAISRLGRKTLTALSRTSYSIYNQSFALKQDDGALVRFTALTVQQRLFPGVQGGAPHNRRGYFYLFDWDGPPERVVERAHKLDQYRCQFTANKSCVYVPFYYIHEADSKFRVFQAVQ